MDLLHVVGVQGASIKWNLKFNLHFPFFRSVASSVDSSGFIRLVCTCRGHLFLLQMRRQWMYFRVEEIRSRFEDKFAV